MTTKIKELEEAIIGLQIEYLALRGRRDHLSRSLRLRVGEERSTLVEQLCRAKHPKTWAALDGLLALLREPEIGTRDDGALAWQCAEARMELMRETWLPLKAEAESRYRQEPPPQWSFIDHLAAIGAAARLREGEES